MRALYPIWIALLALACSSAPARFLRLPGAVTATQVGEVAVRGPYLDATLGDWRLFFQDGDTCRGVLEPGAGVEFVDSGPLGYVRAESGRCTPVGVGSLEHWRSQRGRRMYNRPRPRAQTVSRELYRDSSVVMLRGRFPLATRARMRGDDIVAVLHSDDACVSEITAGQQTGTMEFRQTGRPPFLLFLGGKRCTIEGFIQPI